MKKLPDDAYAIYLAMGTRRSHQAVAKQCGVDKKTVTNRATKEHWKERVAEHERKLLEESERKAHETLGAMDDRQLKVAGYIQARAIETLKAKPLDSAMDAVKAYKLGAEMERMIRGSPSQKQSVIDIEKKIWEDHERYLVPADPEPDPELEPDPQPVGEADAPAPQAAPQPEPEPQPEAEPRTAAVEEQEPEDLNE